MSIRLFAFGAAAIVGLLSGCSRKAPMDAGSEGIATVDGRAVPAWKLEAELDRSGRLGIESEPQRVVEQLIEREQLVARALRLNLDRDAAVLRAWETALIAKLKERELEPALSDAGGADAAPPRVDEPTASPGATREKVRLAVLRLEVQPKAGPEKVRRLEERLLEARTRAASLPPGTPGFGALALDYSDDDATRARGGDLGWFEAEGSNYDLDAQVLAAGLALRERGEISPVVRGEAGLSLVRLTDRKPSQPRSASAGLDEALANHRRHLARREAVEAAFLDETRRTIPVTVNTGLVEQVIRQAGPGCDRSVTGGLDRSVAGIRERAGYLPR